MLLLVSGTAYPRDATVGHLIVPRQWGTNLDLQPGCWAMDNGAFSGFDEGAFMRMLERFADRPGCLFVTAPDVVADAAATLARWPFWVRVLHGLGLPPAFVAQDGIVPTRVPWDGMGALFIGGSTAFKESPEAESLCALAKARGLWVHMGRVNSKRRIRLAQRFGVDSYDGTGCNVAPDVNIPKMQRFDDEIHQQPELRL